MRTYYWDFGEDGHGEGSARQYVLLLNEFLQDHQLECETGVVQTGQRRYAAFCRANPAARALIEAALGPARFSDDAAS